MVGVRVVVKRWLWLWLLMNMIFESSYPLQSILVISLPIECPVWCGGYCMNDSRSLICRQVTIERRRWIDRVQWQKGPAYLEYSPYIRHVALVPYHSTLPPLLSVPRIQLYIIVNTSLTIHISHGIDRINDWNQAGLCVALWSNCQESYFEELDTPTTQLRWQKLEEVVL